MYGRADILAEIATAAGKAQGKDAARPLFVEALDVARKITRPYPRTRTLRTIAEHQAKVGLLRESAETVRELEAHLSPEKADLGELALHKATVGLDAEARAIAVRTETLDRNGVLCTVANTQAKAGRLSEALTTADAVNDMTYKVTLWLQIADKQADARLTSQTDATVEKILAETRKEHEDVDTDLDDSRWNVFLHCVILRSQVGLLAKALATAREIQDPAMRVVALCSVAAVRVGEKLRTHGPGDR